MLRRLLNQFVGDNLRARALRGTALTLTSVGGGHALRLMSNLILTRLLFPEAFGIMAIVNVFMTGLAMFSDVGLNASIVQNKRGDEPDFLNTAWTLQIGRGVFLWLVTLALAIPIAQLYEEPILAEILPIAGLGALVQGFYSTRLATAKRHLRLGRLTGLMLAAQMVSIIVMVFLAWTLQSVWALVIGGLANNLATLALSHTALPGIRNRPFFDRSSANDLIRFGKYIFFATLATFILNHGDRAVLGKAVPLDELAVYNIGFFLASIPILFGRAIADRVLFPLYATRPPSESDENRKQIARSRMMVTGLLFVGATMLAIGGNWLVILLYDPRYESAGPLLVLIAVGAMPMMILQSYGALLLAAGRSGRYAILMTISAAVRLGLLIPAAQYFGTVGVALVPAISELLLHPLRVYLIRPTRGWDPIHDATFGFLAIIVSTLALWINADALAAPLSVLFQALP